MSISFDLPEEFEFALRQQVGNLDAVAKEAALVELYRQNMISRADLGQCLGLSRYETDGVLQRHHVTEDLLTFAELQDQVNSIRGLLDR